MFTPPGAATARERGDAGSYSSPIALSADDQFLWAVNPDLDTVTVIRTDTRRVVAKIPVGKDPRSIALSPDGLHAYVANAADGTVSVIKVRERDPNRFAAAIDRAAGVDGALTTGAEPGSVVVSPDGRRVFVANRSQDTIVWIDAQSQRILGTYDLRDSACNAPDRERHFQPGALAMTVDSRYLLVTRYLSFTAPGGVQRDDMGKEGVVCRLSVDTWSNAANALGDPVVVRLAPQNAGFADQKGNATYAFPNQLRSIVVRGGTAYLPNVAASPSGPLYYQTDTQAYVNAIDNVESTPADDGDINMHLGARVPEAGKAELYFANPDAIAFTSESGAGYAYVASGGSDVLVKLKVLGNGALAFTDNATTTRYIDLNDPDVPETRGENAGKNPIGLAIDASGSIAYVLNYVSRNVSVVDLRSDKVVQVIRTEDLPTPGSESEKMLVGAEVFFSSRGNFVNPSGIGSSRNRMSELGRQSCASCHPGGLTDGVVWQFSTGPRKTLAINGTFNPHNPLDQRIIDASAIFDEVEDADLNTRNVSSPGPLPEPLPCVVSPGYPDITQSTIDPEHGLVIGKWHDFAEAPCVMNAFLLPNGGRPQPTVQLPGSTVEVPVLDAMKEWQHFGIRTPNRPMTRQELALRGGDPSGGVDDAAIAEGRVLFQRAGCSSCHATGKWSLSSKNFLSPPPASDLETEAAATGADTSQFMYRYLKDIHSYGLNVPGSGNAIADFPAIGGVETDSAGLKALGYDFNGDGKGSGFSISSILGTYSLPPYYHNGACETLRCVVSDVNHRSAGLSTLQDPLFDPKAQRVLMKFLESIDANTEPF
ncbi:beta-propeller fold lactonase family protein [Dyella sp. M7H15-1]|uniref:YncE family protein n=1 Tax=Dyella sp. M7H15-1 TaxID=2501295 RepID=UPI0013E8EB76|nr:beta-propeller fold lactonase family protein [Dyella sp. M7H15-1]